METSEKMNKIVKLILFVTGIIAIAIALQFGKAKYVFNIENPVEVHFYEYKIMSDDIKISPEVYTGGEVEISISTEKTGVSVQYQINNGEWQDYIGPFSVSENCNINTRYVADNFVGPVTTKEIENVATVCFDGVNYVTLEEAIEAYLLADDTEEKIKLLADISENIEIPEDEYIAIDLNGHKIESESEYVISVDGTLELIDSSETKGLLNAQNGVAIIISDSGKLILGTETDEGGVDFGPVIVAETNAIVIEERDDVECEIIKFNDGKIYAKDSVVSGINVIDINDIIVAPIGYGILNSTENEMNCMCVEVIKMLFFDKRDENAEIDFEIAQIIKGDTIKILPNVSRAGYTFIGWYSEDGESITEDTVVTEDMEIIAEWRVNTYKIEYNPNGAVGTMENVECIYDTDVAIDECEFSYTGYKFVEWNTNPNGLGKKYNENEIATNLVAEDKGVIILYAIWKDTIVPSNNKPSVISTTSSITATIQQFDEGSGINNSTIKYSISEDNNTWSNWMAGSDTYTFKNLKFNKTYYIKTKVTDNAGNIGISEVAEIKTKKIETALVKIFKYEENIKGREINVTSITSNTPDWVNSNILVDVTVPQMEEGVVINAKVEKGEDVILEKEIQDNNDDFAINTNDDGEYVITVTTADDYNFVINRYYVYVDKTKPNVKFECETTSNSISVIEQIIESDSGIENIIFKLKDNGEIIEENTTGIFENLILNKNYTIFVKATDYAGNENSSQKIVRTKSLELEELAIEGLETNNRIILSENGTEDIWVNEDVSIRIPASNFGTVSYEIELLNEEENNSNIMSENELENNSNIITENELEDNDDSTIENELENNSVFDNEENNENQNNVITATENGKYVLTMTIIDGTNTVIKKYYFNIDKIVPEVSIEPNGINMVIESYENSKIISTVLNTIDNESGVAVRKYAWSLSNAVEPIEWFNFTEGETIIANMSGGTYYLWTNVVDKAGNRAVDVKISNEFKLDYSVKYDLQGGNGTFNEQIKEKNINVSLDNAIPEKEGYRFKGWSTNSETLEIEYAPGSVYSQNKSVIMYAVWAKLVSSVEAQGETVYYESIQDAINDAKTTKSEIKLLDNVTENIVIANGQDITLNMNGKELKANGIAVVNNGIFGFKNGIIEGTEKAVEGEIANLETGYSVVKSVNVINNIEYKVVSLTNIYNVTLNINNGTIVSNNGWESNGLQLNKNIQYGTQYGEMPVVSRTGYTFRGWKIENDISEDINSIITETTTLSTVGNHELVATWTPKLNTPYVVYHYLEKANIENEYDLIKTENLTGTSDSMLSLANISGCKVFNENARIVELNNCSLEKAYTETNTKIVDEVSVSPDGTREIHIYYIRNKFALNVVPGENIVSASGSGIYKWGQTVEISGTVANKEGYTYSDFAWKNSSTSEIISSSVIDLPTKENVENGEIINSVLTMPSSNISISAVATKVPVIYNLTFNANGGTVAVGNPTRYNVESEIELKDVSKQGYTFAGWQLTRLDGKTVSGQPTITTIPEGTVGDREYTAVYTNGSTYYTIYHYVENANDNDYSLQETQVVDSITGTIILLNSSLATNIEYATYKLSTTYLGGLQESSVIVQADGTTKIYVYYSRNKYSLKLEKDSNISSLKINDISTSEGSFKYGALVNISAAVLNETGYTYSNFRWATEDDSILESALSKNTALAMPNENVTITAKSDKEPTRYNILYELNGGSIQGENPTEYNIESPNITLINPIKENYTFIGWTGSNGDSSEKVVTILAGTIGNKTYVANWKKNNYEEVISTTKSHVAYYETLNEAFNESISGNTIITLDNTTENVDSVLPSDKEIILNLSENIIVELNDSSIVNNGKLKITGAGSLSGSNEGDLDNEAMIKNSGILNIENGNISGENVCILSDEEGILNISGGEIISSAAVPLIINNSTVLVTGGKIKGCTYAMYINDSDANVTVGIDDNNISTTTPEIIATSSSNQAIYIENGSTFNYYDGIIISPASTISGTITSKPSGYTVVNGTKLDESTTYRTSVLGPSAPVVTAKLGSATGNTYTSGAWTNQDIYINIESENIGAGIKQYEWMSESTEWQAEDFAITNNVGSSVFTTDRNETLYFRALDNNNVYSEPTEFTIKIDKTPPTYSSIEIKNVTTTGYDVYVYDVLDSGSGVNRVQFPTWTSQDGQDDIQTAWETRVNAKGILQPDGTTWIYRVNITDHNNESGEYITHVYLYDQLNNRRGIGSSLYGNPIIPDANVKAFSLTDLELNNENNNAEISNEEKFVAQINEQKYSSLQDAINNSNYGDEIKLLEDIELEDTLIINENKFITLNMDCKNITSNAIETINNNGIFIIDSMGIIRNEKVNGTVIYNNGILQLENGILTSNVNGTKVVDNLGVFIMNGGKIVTEGIGSYGIYNEINAEATMNSGIIEVTGFCNKAIYNNGDLLICEEIEENSIEDESIENKENAVEDEIDENTIEDVNVENEEISIIDEDAEDEENNIEDVNAKELKTKPKIIISSDDSIGIYNSRDSSSCIINDVYIIIENEEIDNYENIKDTSEFIEKLELIKSSYGIYNESVEDVEFKNGIIIVQRLKGIGIINKSEGNIILGIDDEEVDIANPIIYAISDGTIAIAKNEDISGNIILLDGRIISITSIADNISNILTNYYIFEDKSSKIITLILKKIETVGFRLRMFEEV